MLFDEISNEIEYLLLPFGESHECGLPSPLVLLANKRGKSMFLLCLLVFATRLIPALPGGFAGLFHVVRGFFRGGFALKTQFVSGATRFTPRRVHRAILSALFSIRFLVPASAERNSR